MPRPDPADLTALLNRMLQGDQEAGNEAIEAMYPELRRAASAKLRRERPGHLLETAALINEAIVRLFGTKTVTVQNRQHFFALVCLLMKRILIDSGRRKGPLFACLDESMALAGAPDRERILEIDRILERFGAIDPPGYKALQLKVGSGMTSEEVADALSCSIGTVNRSLRRARAWMVKEMTPLLETSASRHSV